jgi:hypothetical protein
VRVEGGEMERRRRRRRGIEGIGEGRLVFWFRFSVGHFLRPEGSFRGRISVMIALPLARKVFLHRKAKKT